MFALGIEPWACASAGGRCFRCCRSRSRCFPPGARSACAATGLLGFAVFAALLHLSRFYYLYGTTLMWKSVIMLCRRCGACSGWPCDRAAKPVARREPCHEATRCSRRSLPHALVLVLGAVNWSIFAKERIKTNGERIFLALAPVDPRSLMQGDYMALRFEIADRIRREGQRQRAGLLVDAQRCRDLESGPRAPRACASVIACAKARCGWAPMRTSSRKAPPSATKARGSENSASIATPARRCWWDWRTRLAAL